jgi:hypothetical protein
VALGKPDDQDRLSGKSVTLFFFEIVS